ncbi:hypothetical protein D3C71_813800 [compost metagenome]
MRQDGEIHPDAGKAFQRPGGDQQQRLHNRATGRFVKQIPGDRQPGGQKPHQYQHTQPVKRIRHPQQGAKQQRQQGWSDQAAAQVIE